MKKVWKSLILKQVFKIRPLHVLKKNVNIIYSKPAVNVTKDYSRILFYKCKWSGISTANYDTAAW